MMLTVIALVALAVAGVVIPLAIADSVERFGDELHDYFEGEEEDDDD